LDQPMAEGKSVWGNFLER